MNDEMMKIAIFQKKEIRKQLHGGEWWFVISDVIVALTDSTNPSQYLQNLRRRDEELAVLFDPVKKGAVQFEHPLLLPFETSGGRQKLLSWNTEGIFRLIQSIPSKKAEPFKRWLARVGYERVQEIENPELAQKRMKMLYKLKGYPDDWIERRTQGMEVRHDLTEEWQKRGVTEERDYFPKISRTTAVSFHGSRLPLIILNCSWPIPVMSTMSPFLAEPSARSMASRRSGSSVIVAPPTFSMPSRIMSRMASGSSL